MIRGFFAAACLAGALAVPAAPPPRIAVIPGEQMRVNLAESSVEAAADADWRVTLVMENDNGVEDGVLPPRFRRWWHAEIGGLDTEQGTRLHVLVTNAEYSTMIVPVWSTDGGATWERVPQGEGFASQFDFVLEVPPGVQSVRVAKYYPYTMGDFARYRELVTAHPAVTEEVIGLSSEGRPIHMWEVTDRETDNTEKHRVWIHSAVHPAETTAYFCVEGLTGFLLSDEPAAEEILRRTIFNIVPMANPDGVYHGNYRTSAQGINLELEWGAPYDSEVPEVAAMRNKIEEFMGTAEAPGANPIRVLLNLHAAHGSGFPFHFVHRATWLEDGTGVLPRIRELEDRWVEAFHGRSAFVARGRVSASGLEDRRYVEAMMHDRYSLHPEWEDVLAITFEGTYQAGPRPGEPNTPDDYREAGAAMALAIADFLEIALPGEEDAGMEGTPPPDAVED